MIIMDFNNNYIKKYEYRYRNQKPIMPILDITSKVCKMCHVEKNIINYYRAGPTWQVACKPCHNGKSKKPKKPVGFAKLSLVKREKILAELRSTNNYKATARINGIKYCTFMKWKKQQTIHL